MEKDKPKNKQVSIIIPVYNEEKNIDILYHELINTTKFLNKNYEIIFVNDGSTDKTLKVLNELYENKMNVTLRIITLSRRFGQTQAIQAGIDKAEGKMLVLLDGDLQNDPKDIPLLLRKLDEGWDLVNGWRKYRKDPIFSKRFPSFVANILIRYMSKINLHDFGCTLKAIRKQALKDYFLLGNMHRLLPLYLALKGYRVTEVLVSHRRRLYGRSKYGILRIYELILELFRTHFLEKHFSFPLYYFGVTTFILTLAGIVLGIFVVVRKLVFEGIWVSPLFFISIILLFLGIQAFLMGIIAEILVRVPVQNNKIRLYVIKEFKV